MRYLDFSNIARIKENSAKEVSKKNIDDGLLTTSSGIRYESQLL
jgi:hypothetical protein